MNYDSWKLSNGIDEQHRGKKQVAKCAECDDPIFEGETAYKYDDMIFCCRDCALDTVIRNDIKITYL